MKHLRKLLKETAAPGTTGGADVGGYRGVLFSRPVKRRELVNPIKIQKITFHNDARKLRESMLNDLLKEAEEGQFKAIDVISKLRSAEKKYDFGKDTVAFGIEDDEGNTVKVYVRADQAEAFEKTLAEIMNDENEEPKELAEILFNLNDKFTISHVDWGEIEEDEEELDQPERDIPPDEMGGEGEDISLGDEEIGLEDSGDSEAQSALDKVIDMLKADADARTAEAKAKEAEAKAKEAEYAAKSAEAKIKGEEEVLDMEAYFKKQNDEKKEAQKLAKLARYRHEKAAEIEGDAADFGGDTVGDLE